MLRCIEFEYRQFKYKSNSVQVHNASTHVSKTKTKYCPITYNLFIFFFGHTKLLRVSLFYTIKQFNNTQRAALLLLFYLCSYRSSITNQINSSSKMCTRFPTKSIIQQSELLHILVNVLLRSIQQCKLTVDVVVYIILSDALTWFSSLSMGGGKRRKCLAER